MDIDKSNIEELKLKEHRTFRPCNWKNVFSCVIPEILCVFFANIAYYAHIAFWRASDARISSM